MGLILGRFRRKKTTFEQLEKLDTDIKSIEAFRLNTELAQRKIVGHFILVSAGIYILVAVVFYFYFFPATFYDQIFYITPLLLVPFIIWGVKRLLTWYYRRKISRNENKLVSLRAEKKKLLDHVMDTETYKVAKTILEKFAPDQVRKSPTSFDTDFNSPLKSTLRNTQTSTSVISTPVIRTKIDLTKPPEGSTLIVSSNVFKTPINPSLARARAMSTPMSAGPNYNGNGQGPLDKAMVLRQPGMATPLPLPREILPRERSVLDKMVEYLVGDGPSNRYALICKNCHSHNGMALREEFEYFSYRCAYCYHFNPARKQRPAAPKLEFDLPTTTGQRRNSSSTSSSEKNSDPDSETDDKDNKDLQMKVSPLQTSGSPMEVEDISPERQQPMVQKSDEAKKED